MKKLLELAAIGLLAIVPPASAYDLVANGGFETGSLTSWQTFNQGASGGQASWYAHTSGNGTFSGLPASPPPQGSWQTIADNSGRAAAILYQDITVPATSRAVLSFVLWFGNSAPGGTYVNGSSLNPGVTNQRVRVDIIQTTANLLVTSSGVLQLVYQTGAGTPVIQTPTTITQDLTALAGQTVRLRLALAATNGGLIAGVDNLTLEVSPFVLHSTFLTPLQNGAARWGDFNDDGFFDLSLNGSDGFTNQWGIYPYIAGSWALTQSLQGLVSGTTAVADVDRDGDLDVSGVGSSASTATDLMVHRNDGASAFTAIPQDVLTSPIGAHHGSIDWGDHDNDGDLDALITGYHSGPFGEIQSTHIGANDGTGLLTFTFPNISANADGNGRWTDFDQTAHLGIAVCGSNLAGLYRSNLDGTYSSAGPTLPGVTSGAIAVGDLNNDGGDDIVVTGFNGATPIAKVFNIFFGGAEFPSGLTGVSASAVSLGDFDNDGWLDIALCGNTGSSRITRIYHNNGNSTFTDIGAAIPGLGPGSVEFGDFDGDGDLDLVIQGETGTGRLAAVYQNMIPTTNAPPTPPTGLVTDNLLTSTLALSFTAYGVDDHTAAGALTHNFRAGTSPGACDVIAPMSNLLTGRRLIPREGESAHTGLRYLQIRTMGHGNLYWSVQNVDGSYQGSAWAPEQTVRLGPLITQIQDVPGDQGGHVRLVLDRAVLDQAASQVYPAMGYNVWRLVPPGALAQKIDRECSALSPAAATARLLGDRAGGMAAIPADGVVADSIDLPLVEWQGRHFVRSSISSLSNPFPPGTWEVVGSFYATQQNSYVVAALTLADSGSAGNHDASFIVSVHTTTPTVWFASTPASGHSVDNLAPAAPAGFLVAYHTGSGNALQWQAAPEPDFDGFNIYRGATPGFVASPSNLVAAVASPEWTDPGFDSPVVYYKVSTRDHAGNESEAVPPQNTTAVEAPGVPVAFGLSAASPNPFAQATRLAFASPQAVDARLDVFDMAGRLVRTLVKESMPAGEHEVRWDGVDGAGQRVRPGIYFLRLRAGSFSASRRVTLAPR